MKRLLVITVLAVLLLSTIGAMTATAAKDGQAGKSPVWHYAKQITPAGHGTLTINTKQLTYTFEGEGCTPGRMYYLSYTDAGGKGVDIASATADADGSLHIAGTYTDTSQAFFAQLAAAKVAAETPRGSVPPDVRHYTVYWPPTDVGPNEQWGTLTIDMSNGHFVLASPNPNAYVTLLEGDSPTGMYTIDLEFTVTSADTLPTTWYEGTLSASDMGWVQAHSDEAMWFVFLVETRCHDPTVCE